MSVHKKLMDARLKLQAVKMKKSGRNSFAKYEYFELSDFLPHVQAIFAEVGLCGIVSFDVTVATLTITDTETSDSIVIASPMSSADLKGCHSVQNLGAVQTYLRRYLWVAAMEIVEHDPIDGSEPKNEKREYQRISTDQTIAIADLIKETGIKLEAFYKKFNVKSIDALPAEEYEQAIKSINDYRAAREAKNAATV